MVLLHGGLMAIPEMAPLVGHPPSSLRKSLRAPNASYGFGAVPIDTSLERPLDESPSG
jgi:hypothetical protein